MYRHFFKDVLDFYLAIALILFLLPLIILVYLILFILIGSPIFTQRRPGYLNKPFLIYKFKTLIDKDCRDKTKNKKTFRFGTFLRKTGIDEIPQLLNILRGEMSFIGPRPLLMKYLKLRQFANHPRSKCYPGISGLAQIQRNKKSQKGKWKIHLDLDKSYYENMSIFLDLKIFFMTIVKIFLLYKKEDYLSEKPLTKKNL